MPQKIKAFISLQFLLVRNISNSWLCWKWNISRKYSNCKSKRELKLISIKPLVGLWWWGGRAGGEVVDKTVLQSTGLCLKTLQSPSGCRTGPIHKVMQLVKRLPVFPLWKVNVMVLGLRLSQFVEKEETLPFLDESIWIWQRPGMKHYTRERFSFNMEQVMELSIFCLTSWRSAVLSQITTRTCRWLCAPHADDAVRRSLAEKLQVNWANCSTEQLQVFDANSRLPSVWM